MFEFRYDYVTQNMLKKTYFIVYINTDDVKKDIAEDVKTRFNTSNYELDRPLPKKTEKSTWINERSIR